MSAVPMLRPSYDLVSKSFFEDPEGTTFSRMRENHPVYFDPSLSAWILTTYDDVSKALRSPDLSVDRNGEIGRGSSPEVAPQLRSVNAVLSQWMVFADAPLHTRLRSVVSKAFQPQTLRSLVPVIDRIVDELLDDAEQRGSFDVLSDLGMPVGEQVTAHLLGLPPDSPKLLKRWTENIFGFLGAGKASDAIVQANAEGINAFRAFVRDVIDARRGSPGDDLVTQLIADAKGDYTEEELVGLVITLIVGAFETTAYSITNGLYALLRHPQQLQLLRAQPQLIEGAVEETLRFDGPALSVQRRAKYDLTIRDTTIRERDRIYCMLHAANHDPAMFSQPSRLDITRTPCRQLGLGLGPHFCLGAWLTRLEAQRAILKTVQRFPNLRLAEGSQPEWIANFAIRGLTELVLSTSASGWFKRPDNRE